jgi:organic radical activating enzyme
MAEQEIGSFWTCGPERMICFAPESINGCCFNQKTGKAPRLGNYGPGGTINIDALVSAKREHLAAVRRGEVPDACVDCPSRQKNQWPESPYLFNDIVVGQITACNTDCYYCESNSNTAPVVVPARTAPRVLAVLKEMDARAYIDPNATIRFSGGEPTLLREFEQIVDYFIATGRRFFVNTSGVKFSPAIERMLCTGNLQNRLVISPDAASPETYKAIKRIDVGKRVWDNIARYAQIAPDILEVKYIVLPENWHETGDFVDKCHKIGVKRVSFDVDYRPLIAGIRSSLTDEIVEAIAILVYEAKQRGMSVYHSGSGDGTWKYGDGQARLEAAMRRKTAGRLNLVTYDTRFVGLVRAPEDFRNGTAIAWGRLDNATMARLDSEPNTVHLQEDRSAALHRVEQTGIAASAGKACTIEVIARSAGRSKLMIEFRDDEARAYTRAKYDLERATIAEALDDGASVGRFDGQWVRCQLTLTPASSSAIFNVTLVDEMGSHIYQGTGRAGIYIRPPILYRHNVAKVA